MIVLTLIFNTVKILIIDVMGYTPHPFPPPVTAVLPPPPPTKPHSGCLSRTTSISAARWCVACQCVPPVCCCACGEPAQQHTHPPSEPGRCQCLAAPPPTGQQYHCPTTLRPATLPVALLVVGPTQPADDSNATNKKQ